MRLGGNVTRDLAASILTESEEHVDRLGTQLYRSGRVGIENYLSEQTGGHDRWRSASRYWRSTS